MACALMLIATGPTGASVAAGEDEPRVLAERHFQQLYGFNSVEAYEQSTGAALTRFAVARRWVDGQAELLVDVRHPIDLAKFAFLLRRNRDRMDDLFVYFPDLPQIRLGLKRRVRRLAAIPNQLSGMVSLSVLRPIATDELDYRRLAEEEVEGELCNVIEGVPKRGTLPFDRIELALSPSSGFALRTRYFAGERELRQVLISPNDIREFAGRILPGRRRIVHSPSGRVSELRLVNAMVDISLPDRLFTKHNLRVQRFPSF
jgi:hypothetical protein